MTTITKKVTKEVDEVDYYECDGCGKKSTKENFHTDFGVISIIFGFGSKNDGDKYEGSICDVCFEQLQKILPNLKRKNGL